MGGPGGKFFFVWDEDGMTVLWTIGKRPLRISRGETGTNTDNVTAVDIASSDPAPSSESNMTTKLHFTRINYRPLLFVAVAFFHGATSLPEY